MTAAGVERPYDLVLYGASGFVGRLVAAELAHRRPGPDARIALAGRSRERLAAVRRGLGPAASGWALLVADAGDHSALDALAASSRAVISTVGPYWRYGLPLVQACAGAGTHYADLTGEVLFHRASIDTCQVAAASSGARIVHSCGFDSIPSDLGVLLLAQAAAADDAGGLGATTLTVLSARGGISGGTIDSLRAQQDAVRADRGVVDVLRDPYALSPAREEEPDLEGRDVYAVRRQPERGGWVGPFVMAPYNTRVVRRSNALSGWSYGRRFRYREVVRYGRGPRGCARALATTGGLGLVAAGLRMPASRTALDRLLPAPGSGPDEKARRNGRFRMQIETETDGGVRYLCTVAAAGDPGYAATSLMLAEGGLCLAFDRPRLPARAGVLTPATAMGTVLVERLRAAGMTFDVRRS
ncbi:MAG: saccharopine dehydrogenase NADP-binding domain-containing protein [Actinomycetota bacterium]|nr:saccharopine dehydrogenase NADP-binding domain-containing protein [Actinomycetota bacterium]